MALIDQINNALTRDISTVALDSPLASRRVEYTDSNNVPTGDYRHEVRLFNNTGGAVVLGQVAMVDYTGVVSTSPQVITLATSTPKRDIAVATETTANQAWGWFAVSGFVNALVEGTAAVASGNFLKCTSGTSTTGFIKDGAALTDNSAAVAYAAQAAGGNVLTKCFVLGAPKTIA